MKTRLILFIVMLLSVSASAQYGQKSCDKCGGDGKRYESALGREIKCYKCGGDGRIPITKAEYDAIQQYGQTAVDFMSQNNMTIEEYFAYEECMKEAMAQKPIYQACQQCNRTGRCKYCGGYMNVSLDGPAPCIACGGSGICTPCKGTGNVHVGYGTNPNKDALLKRAQQILDNARKRGRNR